MYLVTTGKSSQHKGVEWSWQSDFARFSINKKAGQGGLSARQTVSVVMERDDAPRSVEVPADLQAALDADRAAREAWARLSFTHQREEVEAITTAKRPETRARRIAKAIERLLAGKSA